MSRRKLTALAAAVLVGCAGLTTVTVAAPATASVPLVPAGPPTSLATSSSSCPTPTSPTSPGARSDAPGVSRSSAVAPRPGATAPSWSDLSRPMTPAAGSASAARSATATSASASSRSARTSPDPSGSRDRPLRPDPVRSLAGAPRPHPTDSLTTTAGTGAAQLGDGDRQGPRQAPGGGGLVVTIWRVRRPRPGPASKTVTTCLDEAWEMLRRDPEPRALRPRTRRTPHADSDLMSDLKVWASFGRLGSRKVRKMTIGPQSAGGRRHQPPSVPP